MRSYRQGSNTAAARQLALVLSEAEILASVRSLYDDDLKSFGRTLLRRLRERSAATIAQAAPNQFGPKHLRSACEKCSQLVVVPEDGKEYSVALISESRGFPDICSPVDPYPEEMWAAAAEYFDMAEPDAALLPNSRYSCALELVSRGLLFLRGYSLGQVCHIVHLAIAKRHLLGYRSGLLAPYRYSDDCLKEHSDSPQKSTGAEAYCAVTWEEAPVLLQQLLASQEAQPHGITLSNLKRLFRLHFQQELNENALGHVRLLELMRDSRLSDVCTLYAQPNSQTVVRAVEQAPTVGRLMGTTAGRPSRAAKSSVAQAQFWRRPSISSEDARCRLQSCSTSSTAESSLDSTAPSETDEAEVFDDFVAHWSVSIKNTFIDVCFEDAGLQCLGSQYRSHSVPSRVGARGGR